MISTKKQKYFIIISLFIITTAIICIAIFLYTNTPAKQFQKAYKQTFSETDFSWINTIQTLLSNSNVSQETSITVNNLESDYLPDYISYASGISADLSSTFNPVSCYSSGKASFSYSGIPVTDGIYSNTDQEFLFSFPDLLSGTFRIPLEIPDFYHNLIELIPSLGKLFENRDQYCIKSVSRQDAENVVSDSDWHIFQILPPETNLQDLTCFCYVDSENYIRQILLSFQFHQKYYTIQYHLEGSSPDSLQDIILFSQSSDENEDPFLQLGYHGFRSEHNSKIAWMNNSDSAYHTVLLSSSEESDYKQTYKKITFNYLQSQNDKTFLDYISESSDQLSNIILSGTMTYLSSFDHNTNIYEINCKQLLIKAEQLKTECTLSFHNTIHSASDSSESIHFSEPYYNLFELTNDEINSLQKEIFQHIIGSLVWS